MSKQERKIYDDTMPGLAGFGQIISPTGCDNTQDYILSLLQKQVPADTALSWETLTQQMVAAYEVGQELNLCTGKDGGYEKGKFSEKTTVYGIGTGYFSPTTIEGTQGNLIYAFFFRYQDSWIGLHFTTEEEILSAKPGLRMGKLWFTNEEKATEFLNSLESNLLPGDIWTFGPEQTGKLDILQGYLSQVSEKLYAETKVEGSLNQGKLMFSQDESMALWNTGLLNKFTGDIHIMGQVRSFETGGFFIKNPTIVSGAKELTRNGFDPSSCPGKVVFFQNLEELIFQAQLEIQLDDVKLGEIIEEAAERGNFPPTYALLCANAAWSTLTGLLKTAVEKAQKIARHHYKYIIPQYAPAVGTRPGCVQFLMPIYLQTDLTKEPDFLGSPDFVLVLQSCEGGYVPESIIQLAQAYGQSKLIATPDSKWLQANEITQSAQELLQESILMLQENGEETRAHIATEVIAPPELPEEMAEEEMAEVAEETTEEE